MRWHLIKFIKDKPAQPKARLLLAHGAGAGAGSDFMCQLATQLQQHHIEVWRFNFAYMQRFIDTGKRSLPDKFPLLQQQFRQLIEQCPDDYHCLLAVSLWAGVLPACLARTVR